MLVLHSPDWPHVRLCFIAGVVALTVSIERSLKPLDIEIMKRLGTRVHVIPVIAKADTLTQNDLFTFKQRVRLLLALRNVVRRVG